MTEHETHSVLACDSYWSCRPTADCAASHTRPLAAAQCSGSQKKGATDCASPCEEVVEDHCHPAQLSQLKLAYSLCNASVDNTAMLCEIA